MKKSEIALIVVIGVVLLFLLTGTGMYQGMMGYGKSGYGCGFGSGAWSGYGINMFLGWIIHIIVFILIVLGIIWIVQQFQNTGRKR